MLTTNSAAELIRNVRTAWAPPPRMLVSEWAASFRHLSPEASAEPGLWQNERAPHLVAPMDALSPYDPAERVVCKFSSQSGKTEIILNFCGYIIDLDPGPVLAIQPNITPMGESFSKDRITPMLRDSPSLARKVGQAKSRNSASTILHKSFPSGHLTVAGANSPAGLASRPIRFLVADELDRWEVTKEGDPLLLARKRQQTFRARRRSKELVVSSPTYDDLGISAEYDRCSQRYEWRLSCLHCGEHQLPRIAHFSWDGKDPKTARYACEHCGGVHSLDDEAAVKASGAWFCTADEGRASVGYWFNQFASPFARWDDTIAEWIDAQGDHAKMQAVVNTAFAEGWEGESDKIEPHVLRAREEAWGEDLPEGACLITMGADVQIDRIEVETVAWGHNRESWSIDYKVLPGEPSSLEVWEDLLDLYRSAWKHPNGAKLAPAVLCVDSGAFTQHVYEFCKRVKDRGIIPIKGVAGLTRDQIDMDLRARNRRVAKRLQHGKPPELLGVDALKMTVYQFLAAEKGRRGYCHFPVGRSDEYYAQLTGERLVVVQQRGKRPERRWKPIHAAVEALDCRVYAYAALLFYGLENLKPPDPPTDDGEKKPKRARPARQNFATGW